MKVKSTIINLKSDERTEMGILFYAQIWRTHRWTTFEPSFFMLRELKFTMSNSIT